MNRLGAKVRVFGGGEMNLALQTTENSLNNKSECFDLNTYFLIFVQLVTIQI